ncbi:RHD3/Sey1 [Amanita muscaria]
MPAPTPISNTPFPSAPNNEGSSATERKQIIDDEKNFTSDLDAQIEQWGLRQAGFSYNIVSVFGSQSTGKSTLLNRLFGTNFDVMDESRRQQTTKGIWMCRAANSNILVMDVEGTDGRERGEDQDFERKSALFSLASSEVLIVNLWEHQVGLYQGANMGLLRTVFEVNLGLFGKKALEGTSGRTLLLFVVRDHVSPAPLANLQATVTADLERIWHSLSKPAELRDHKLSDFFDLAFTSLPHKLLQPDKFEAEVAQLRTRFVNKDQDGFFFKPAYHKRVPADGVSFYMQSIWEQVQSNKDLDLPTQQELLAQFRCDEISKVALSEFNEQAKSQKRPVEGGQVVEGLGVMMTTWRNEAQMKYDREASRYHQQVYKRKRADLITAMNTTLSALFVGQLRNLHKASLVAFKQQMVNGVKDEKYNFANVVAEARKFCEDTFMSGAKEALIEGTDWSWQEELELLKEEIQHVADQFRRDETKKMVNLIERKFKSRISDPVEMSLNKATPDMWDDVLAAFKGALTQAEETYTAKANSFNCTEEENTTSLAELRRRTWQALRAKIDEQVTEPLMLGKLRNSFEERFRYDETGVPRVWKPSDDIKSVFKGAKEETLALVPLYAKISPKDPENEYEVSDDDDAGDDFDFASSKVIFSETKVHDLQTKFSRDADANYVEAERSTVAGFAQIPRWMYALLVVLGWNEAMAILFNPMYFTALLVALVTTYFIIQLGLAGPVYHIASRIFAEVWDQGVEVLRRHLTQPAMVQAEETSRSRLRNDTMTDGEVREELRTRQY